MKRNGYIRYELEDYVKLEEMIVEKIKKLIWSYDFIYIYGAGFIGKNVLVFLRRHGGLDKYVSGFLVSDKKNNPKKICNIDVLDITDVNRNNAGIILALGVEYHKFILQKLKDIHGGIVSFDAYEYGHMYWCNHQLLPQCIDKYKNFFAQRFYMDDAIHKWKNILIVCMDRIGDVIINIPFIRELRYNVGAKTRIDIVAQPSSAQFMKLCPYINNVIVCDKKEYAGVDTEDSIIRSKCFADKYLRSIKYEVVFLTGWHNIDIEGLFLAVFSNAGLRIGFSEHNMLHKEFCNRGYDHFLSMPIKSKTVMHDVERALSIITTLGGNVKSKNLEIWTKDEDKKLANQFFAENNLEKYDVIAVVAHALDGARMWDWKKYAELIRSLNEKYDNLFFVLLGGTEARSVCDKITDMVNCNNLLNICGATSLCEVTEILRRCRLYIGADTGLKHIAAAVGLSTVEIICHAQEGDPLEYSSPDRYRAWGNKSFVVRPKKALPGCGATCYKRRAHCINQISVSDVLAAVDEVLIKN